MKYPTISFNQLDEYIRRNVNMQLIDLRSPEAYGAGHVKGAVNIPFEELPDRINELPTGMPLLFYCSRGGQSMLACRDLARMGYHVINIANGFKFYRGEFFVTGEY